LRRGAAVLGALGLALVLAAAVPDPLAEGWRKLPTEPYAGKQDDVFFKDRNVGWYGNGAGKIWKTTDGGATWSLLVHRPGTFFRCLAFVDERLGFAGNVGVGYFPNVTDSIPLYRTEDGGATWQAVTAIDGPPVAGLCALQVLREPRIAAGVLDTLMRIVGVGRVGGPARMIVSDDLGRSFRNVELGDSAGMALDVHFFDHASGLVAAASDAAVQRSNAVILATDDAGRTWRTVYRSRRPFEATWKISFPTRQVGYVTVQSYDPDTTVVRRYVARTDDGGRTWRELPLVDEHRVREFGVAFVDTARGWVGAVPNGFATRDGGRTWTRAGFGNAVNKLRVIRDPAGVRVFAIGRELHALDLPPGR
jgi:photosystem II stability/assembly factor-like uncharacterized protein